MRCSEAIRAVALLACLAGTGGCRTAPTRAAAVHPLWPPPPAAPRVAYVGEAGGPADLGIAPTFGQRVANWIAGGDRGRAAWECPFGVCLGDAGELCFTDTARREVVWVDAERKHLERWDRVGRVELAVPVSVAMCSGRVYVVDSGLARVLIATPAGAPLGALDFAFRRPVAVAAGGGRVYVADALAGCVQIFAEGGAWRGTLGRPGDGPGEFNHPTHLALDAADRLYVTDSLNCRVQVFDAAGRAVRAIGRPGDSSGHFGRPKGVAVDESGDVLVVDGLHEVVQIFDAAGRLALDFGGSGHAAGEFWLPAGLAVNGRGDMVVADSYNQRLQFFRLLEAPGGGAP